MGLKSTGIAPVPFLPAGSSAKGCIPALRGPISLMSADLIKWPKSLSERSGFTGNRHGSSDARPDRCG